VNERQAGIEFALAVLPSFSALFQPPEGVLDNSTFWQHAKRMEFFALDHLHCCLQPLHHTVGKGLARVAAINQPDFHLLQIRLAPINGAQTTIAIITSTVVVTATVCGKPCV
jgi:hypothetical protein